MSQERLENTLLARLRARLARHELPIDSRLPPERTLARELEVSRGELRKALATLEAEGHIWRHVGKGTFIGSRPIETANDIASLANRTNPAEVMRIRLILEPEAARLAAVNATPAQIGEMRNCLVRTRAAQTWRQYETWDNRLHRIIGEATQNRLLLTFLDTLSAVRRAVAWGRQRMPRLRPAANHHSFAEHEAIVAAIVDRDPTAASLAMRRHLETVERNLLHPPTREARSA
jgi:DNA-binding FadR family transcriptional regulator